MKNLLIHDAFFTLEDNLSCIRELLCGGLCYALFVFEINLSCIKELICGGLC